MILLSRLTGKISLLAILLFTNIPFVFAEDDHSEIHDLMAHLLDPAAEAIWDSAGFVITEEGEFSLEPKNQEEWDKVLYGAKVISESAFLLSRPQISKNREDWIAVSSLLKTTR